MLNLDGTCTSNHYKTTIFASLQHRIIARTTLLASLQAQIIIETMVFASLEPAHIIVKTTVFASLGRQPESRNLTAEAGRWEKLRNQRSA